MQNSLQQEHQDVLRQNIFPSYFTGDGVCSQSGFSVIVFPLNEERVTLQPLVNAGICSASLVSSEHSRAATCFQHQRSSSDQFDHMLILKVSVSWEAGISFTTHNTFPHCFMLHILESHSPLVSQNLRSLSLKIKLYK